MSTAKVQAAVAVGLAAALGGAYLCFGMPLRVRWIVARGAPPADRSASARAEADLRTLGVDARPALLAVLDDEDSSRARKSWVASILIRSPFFAQDEVVKSLGSPWKPTARAAAFALLEGEENERFDVAASQAEGRSTPSGPSPLDTWDPKPAIPVLLDWIADRADPEAKLAALLLGKLPQDEVRVRDALLAAVEDAPNIRALGKTREALERKLLVVDALQALLPWARNDPETAARVAAVIARLDTDGGAKDDMPLWDIEAYALRLFEVARGRGVDPALLVKLLKSRNKPVRMQLAHTLETVNGPETERLLRALCRDEEPTVRRSTVFALKKRMDPLLLDLLPYVIEDSYVYIRSDALKSVGDLIGTATDRCRSAIPLLVSCLEEPWPGQPQAPTPEIAASFENARADIIEGCALSLHRITTRSPGFEEMDPKTNQRVTKILDWKSRMEIARRLAADPARRKAVVDEWRKGVPPWPESRRVKPLVEHLEDPDFDNVLRAGRELARVTGDRTGFPAQIFETGDDTGARNALREAAKAPEWAKTLDHWRTVAAEWERK
jgi:hypothetical protein